MELRMSISRAEAHRRSWIRRKRTHKPPIMLATPSTICSNGSAQDGAFTKTVLIHSIMSPPSEHRQPDGISLDDSTKRVPRWREQFRSSERSSHARDKSRSQCPVLPKWTEATRPSPCLRAGWSARLPVTMPKYPTDTSSKPKGAFSNSEKQRTSWTSTLQPQRKQPRGATSKTLARGLLTP